MYIYKVHLLQHGTQISYSLSLRIKGKRHTERATQEKTRENFALTVTYEWKGSGEKNRGVFLRGTVKIVTVLSHKF
jgi:hypothetical protein